MSVFNLITYAVRICILLAPVPTMRQVVEAREYAGVGPASYILSLLRCILCAWYQTEFVTNGKGDTILMVINIFGISLQVSYLVILYFYSTAIQRTTIRRYLYMALGIAFFTVLSSLILIWLGYSPRILCAISVTACSLFSSCLSRFNMVILMEPVLTLHYPIFYFNAYFGLFGIIYWRLYLDVFNQDPILSLGDGFALAVVLAKGVYYVLHWIIVEEENREIWNC